MTYDVRVEYIVLPLGSDDEVISGFFKVEKDRSFKFASQHQLFV